MATGNVNLTSTESNVIVTSTPSNIIVTDIETGDQITVTSSNTNVSVTNNTTNVTVSEFALFSNSTIRAALSNVSPILYDSSTGVFSFDNNASFAAKTTDDLAEGNINLYYTTDRANSAIANYLGTFSPGNTTLTKWQETVVDNGNISGNVTFDITNGTIHTANIIGNITNITFSNISQGGSATLLLDQDVIGNHILDTSLLTTWKWVGDYKTLDSAPGNTTMISVVYDGTEYEASLVRFDDFNINNAIRDYTGNLENLTGNITTTANIQGAYFIGDGSGLSNVGGLDSFSVTTNTASGNGSLSYSNITGVFTFTPADTSLATKTTTDLAEGTNLYYTDSRFDTRLATKTTTDLTEGTNLYYTTGRANSAITTYFGDSGNAPFTFAGNVEVQGNLNYQNVTDLYVTDQKITLNANAASDATVEIIANRPVAGANTVLRWNETSDIWEFTNDGSTYYPIPTSTTDLAEGTNLYFSNTRVNAFIQDSITTSDIDEGTNLYYTTDRANSAILGYTGDITQMGQANISRLYVGEDDLGLDSGLVNLHDFQMIKQDLYFDAKQLNRNGSAGINLAFLKGGGTVATPANNNVRDRLVEFDYWGYNPSGSGFQQYLNTAGMWAYHDVDPNAVANVIPIAHEFWVREDGDISKSEQSVMALRSDRTITFNDTTTRGTATNGIGGNANITADGTINTVSGINATGTITGGNLTIAGLSYPFADGSNGQVLTTDGAGTLSFVSPSSPYGDANVDAHLNTATATTGQVLSWDGADYDWITNAGGYSNVDVQNFLENGYSAANINANDIVAVTFTGDGSDLTDVRTETVEVTLKVAATEPTGNILKGYPVHAVGYSGTGEVEAVLADAGNAQLMPAHFIALEDIIGVGSTGRGLLTGRISGVDTSGFQVGETIYVAVGGGYSNTAPTGEANQIQNLGIVTRIDATQGGGEVYGAGRSAATPNLNDGNFFLGNATNQAVTADFTDEANTAILNYTGDLTQYNQANISRLAVGHGNIGLDNGFTNLTDFQLSAEGTSTPDSFVMSSQYNGDTSIGQRVLFIKGRGTNASPGNAVSRDRIVEFDYYGRDPTGTGFGAYIDGAGYHVYHDDTPTSGVVPTAHEWWVQDQGSLGERSVLALRSDRTITFNDSSLRGDTVTGNRGNANIEVDGTINTVSNVNATGNMSATNFIGSLIGAPSSLAGLTTDDLTEGASNLYFTTANFNNAILNYGGDITQLGQANISRLYVGEDDLKLDSGLVNLHDLQQVKEDIYFDAKQLNRNGSTGINLSYIKGRGLVSTPVVNNIRDRIAEFDHYAYNPSGNAAVFQDYLNTAGYWTYHDGDPSTTANVIPIAHEFWVREDGDYFGKSEVSVLTLHSDRTVSFNDTSTRGISGTGNGGNANITADGTINTVAGINATGTVTANNFSGSGTTLTGINSFGTIDVSGQTSVIAGNVSANLTLAAAGAIEITTDAANGIVTIGGTGGTYGNVDVENFLSANVMTANLDTTGNIVANKDISTANALFTNSIYSYTPGGTFNMTALRVNDFKANDPLGIATVANSALSSGPYASPFTGAIAFVTGDRSVSGDGLPIYWSGTSWRYFDTNGNVTI